MLEAFDSTKEQEQLIAAMQTAHSALSQFHAAHQLDVDSVDEQLQQWKELSEEQRDVDRLLSSPHVNNDGDGDGMMSVSAKEVEAEYEEMERQLNSPPSASEAAIPATTTPQRQLQSPFVAQGDVTLSQSSKPNARLSPRRAAPLAVIGS